MSKGDHCATARAGELFRWCVVAGLLCSSTTTADDPVATEVIPPVDMLDNPIWVESTALLYAVCKLQSKIYSFDPTTGEYTSAKVENVKELDFVVPVKNQTNLFAAGAGSRLVTFEWDATQDQQIQIIGNVSMSLGNDTMYSGTTDGKGRLWAVTTMGSVYSVNANGKLTEHLSDLGSPHGSSFSVYNTKFYYVETDQGVLKQHDFDFEAGEIGLDSTIIFDFVANNITGEPNGMTIDSENNVWVAMNGTNSVVKINPTNGTLVENIHVRNASVSSVVYGGVDLDVMFVTTSNTFGGNDTGTLYNVTDSGATGVPGVPFDFA